MKVGEVQLKFYARTLRFLYRNIAELFLLESRNRLIVIFDFLQTFCRSSTDEIRI